MNWKAKDAAKIVGGSIVRGNPGTVAKGLSTDSRRIKPGQAFIALRGERFDGHDFVKKAVKRGAPWVMVERADSRVPAGATVIETADTLFALGKLAAAYRRQFKVKVAAVTGSVGKSTVKEMLAALLASKGRVLRNHGNLNNRIGLPLTLFRLNRSHDLAVLEMGCNEPGEIQKLMEIAKPDAGLITGVAPVHLQGLGSIQGVAKAKAEMIRGLGPGSTFILNLDDPLIAQHVRGFRGKLIGFSTRKDTRFRGESLHLLDVKKEVAGGGPRIQFRIQRRRDNKDKGRAREFFLKTLSRHDAVNALAACAMGRAFGVSLEEAAFRVRGFKGLSLRGEVIKSRRGFFIVNDSYNASPASVENALETLAWWKGPLRGVAVLGEMMELGRYAKEYHRKIGIKAVEAGVELLVAKGPNAGVVVEGALAAGLLKKSMFVARDNEQAVQILKKHIEKGDWVLIKGSRAMGMETVVGPLLK